MEKLLTSLLRTSRSLLLPGMPQLFAKTTVFTMLVMAVFIALSVLAVSWLSHHVQGQAVANFMPWLGSISGTTIGWILFPAMMPIIIKFFEAQIAMLIEEKDYPNINPPAHTPFWIELLHDLRFSCTAIVLNVIVFPLYMLPVINLMLFYLLNGYLLGHAFFLMAARRYVSVHEAQAMFTRYGSTIIMAGIALTIIATIPVINVITPFLSIAFMVHLYHRLDRRLTLERV